MSAWRRVGKDRALLKPKGCGTQEEPLREFAAVAAGVFEEGEEVGHAEEGVGGLVHIDEFEFAAAGAAVDVECGERAEAGGVHVLDVFHVDDDALLGGSEIADFVAEMGRVIGDEFPVAFDDRSAFDAVGVDAEGVGGMWRRIGQGVAPQEGLRLDYSGFARRWEFVRCSESA